ncbi:MAG: NADH-quinone oxidoreductase subunit J, partial [Bdellovibrionales bacterium]
ILLAQLALLSGAWIIAPDAITAVTEEEGLENTRALGQVLFTDYAYPFQVAGLVLLVAMVGAIVLTLRDRQDARRQKAGRQIEVSVSDIVEVKKVISKQGVEL